MNMYSYVVAVNCDITPREVFDYESAIPYTGAQSEKDLEKEVRDMLMKKKPEFYKNCTIDIKPVPKDQATTQAFVRKAV